MSTRHSRLATILALTLLVLLPRQAAAQPAPGSPVWYEDRQCGFLVPETRGLIGEAELRKMKPTAYLINTARGPLVQDAPLVRALRERWIAGAALDVVEQEPPALEHPLRRMDHVILTPHVAFYSEQSVQELQRKTAEEVVRLLSGRGPRSPVNVPRPAPR